MRITSTFLFLLFFTSTLIGSTYFKIWVNGSNATSLEQGDMLAWEYDLSQAGGSATFEIYLDLNGNKVIDESDILFEYFTQKDGEPANDGPGDSSLVADALIYTDLGPFGFAPAVYLFRVIDDGDQSAAFGALTVTALPNPTIKISGYLSVEGIEAPDAKLENYMIGGQAAQDFQGFWSGLTDENGYYEIVIPESALGNLWEIDPFFDYQFRNYNKSDKVELIIENGLTTNINFFVSLPEAWVYGDLIDELGNIIIVNEHGGLVRQSDYEQFDFEIENGHFSAPAVIPENEDGDWFSIHVNNDGLNPEYLAPNYNDSTNSLYVSRGDSIQRDVLVYSTDASVFVRVFLDNEEPGQAFLFYAYSEQFGSVMGYSDEAGYGELSVKAGSGYSVNIVTEPDHGTPLPAGYTFDGPQWLMTNPGDTVTFNLVPAGAAISGKITISPGDPTYFFDKQDISIEIRDTSWSSFFNSYLNDNMEYWQPVQNGAYNIQLDDWSGDYLPMPSRYERVFINDDTLSNIDFELNYTHAMVEVKLLNAPENAFDEDFNISSSGIYPDIYETRGNYQGDNSFYFRVCEGEWHFQAPLTGGHYGYFENMDTVITISVSDSSAYIEFDYAEITAIKSKDVLPNKFYVKQNYPNPFNPLTNIEFGISHSQHVDINIYDITGRLIESLYSGKLQAGVHNYSWNASAYSSGMYFYRIKTTDKDVLKKLILLK